MWYWVKESTLVARASNRRHNDDGSWTPFPNACRPISNKNIYKKKICWTTLSIFVSRWDSSTDWCWCQSPCNQLIHWKKKQIEKALPTTMNRLLVLHFVCRFSRGARCHFQAQRGRNVIFCVKNMLFLKYFKINILLIFFYFMYTFGLCICSELMPGVWLIYGHYSLELRCYNGRAPKQMQHFLSLQNYFWFYKKKNPCGWKKILEATRISWAHQRTSGFIKKSPWC